MRAWRVQVLMIGHGLPKIYQPTKGYRLINPEILDDGKRLAFIMKVTEGIDVEAIGEYLTNAAIE